MAWLFLCRSKDLFYKVLRVSPSFARASEVYLRLGVIFKRKGDYNKSMENFKKALTIPGPSSFNKLESKRCFMEYVYSILILEDGIIILYVCEFCCLTNFVCVCMSLLLLIPLPLSLYILLFVFVCLFVFYWRVSEASETLSSLFNRDS